MKVTVSALLRNVVAEIRQTVPSRHKALVALGMSPEVIKDLAELEIYIQSLRDMRLLGDVDLYGRGVEKVKERLTKALQIDKRLSNILDELERIGQEKADGSQKDSVPT